VLRLDETGVYKRIGMSEHDSGKGWFGNAEVKSFRVLRVGGRGGLSGLLLSRGLNLKYMIKN